jgi:hypothetical protein
LHKGGPNIVCNVRRGNCRFGLCSDGPWRFAAFAAVGDRDVHPDGRGAARYRIFLLGEIEIGLRRCGSGSSRRGRRIRCLWLLRQQQRLLLRRLRPVDLSAAISVSVSILMRPKFRAVVCLPPFSLSLLGGPPRSQLVSGCRPLRIASTLFRRTYHGTI